MGLHQRYAEILGDELSVTSLCLSKKEEEFDAIAKKWASVISNKYVREQAEEAARIALRHGIKELPDLREADLGRITKYHGIRASFHAGLTDELPSVIRVNKRGYRGWKEAHANAVRYGQLAQDNPILHELGHYIDYCNDSTYYRKLEHSWKMENVDETLIKKNLSTYALTDYAEFEAELNAAIMRGKVLPKELLSYSHMNNVDTPLAKRLLSLGSGDSVCLPSEEVSKGFKDAMKALFHQKGSSFSIDIMADENVQSLIEAHTSVLDRNLQRLEMSDLMRQRLTRSNYIFSGLKTFHELNEAFPSLLDENGNKKTFERFLNDEPTPHDEAMSLGEEALQTDKKGIFRFNSGKEQKTFPDYNPYTIKRCRDCDIAKGKLNLGFVPENELCAACKLVHKCQDLKGCVPDEIYGNRLLISKQADQSEIVPNTRAARALVSSFPDMTMQIRKDVVGFQVKNPEYLINGMIADRKGILSPNGVASGFNKAIKQGCSAVVIDLDMHPENFKELQTIKMASAINNRHMDFENGTIQECYVVFNGKAVRITANHFVSDTKQTKENIKIELDKIKGDRTPP